MKQTNPPQSSTDRLQTNSPLQSEALKAYSLEGQVALITGGGSGLGLATARCLSACGARVILLGRQKEPLMQACRSIGDLADFRVHDITDFNGSKTLIASILESCSRLDILVNNAGVHLKKPAADTSVEEFRKVLDTHVFAAHALVREVLPGMLNQRHGSILYTASMASLIGLPQVVAYSAAKSAYLGIVRTLAAEVSGEGIRVNAIAPGWIETPMLRQALNNDTARRDKILQRTPMHRFGEPEDIGWTAAFLCSPAARFITGCVLPVDGGASIGL